MALAIASLLPNGAEASDAASSAGDASNTGGTSALQEVTILAQFTPAETARKAQQEAPNLIEVQTYAEIKKLPDISTAEAVRRISGISLETDEGKGRYLNIRGIDADLNSTTFGGLRLPPTNNASPFGGYRAITLDSIPADTALASWHRGNWSGCVKKDFSSAGRSSAREWSCAVEVREPAVAERS